MMNNISGSMRVKRSQKEKAPDPRNLNLARLYAAGADRMRVNAVAPRLMAIVFAYAIQKSRRSHAFK